MWWRDRAGVVRPAAAIVLAGLVGACFQPLYGDKTVGGGAAVRDALAAVDIDQIDAPKGTPLSRIAVETRNELVFDLTGGGGQAPSTHRLIIRLIPSKNTITLPVQVNGKKRADVTVARNAQNREIETAVLALDAVQKALEGRAPKKVIVVPQRIVNVVA